MSKCSNIFQKTGMCRAPTAYSNKSMRCTWKITIPNTLQNIFHFISFFYFSKQTNTKKKNWSNFDNFHSYCLYPHTYTLIWMVISQNRLYTFRCCVFVCNWLCYIWACIMHRTIVLTQYTNQSDKRHCCCCCFILEINDSSISKWHKRIRIQHDNIF